MKEAILSIIKRIKLSISNLFNRFPIATIYIILQYIILTLITESNYFDIHPKQMFFLVLVSLTTYALIFHSIIIQLLTERYKWELKKNILFNLLSVFITSLVFVIFTYKDFIAFDTLDGTFTGNLYRLGVFVALSGLLTILIPFWKDKENKTWWKFTMYSINKIAISLVYSIVIYIGISIALSALSEFWSITLFDNQFELLAIFSFILFAPLNFLSDVYDFKFKGELLLPKFMTIFGKFILTPLVVIYTAILYPYMFSFPFKQTWPSNQSTFIILAMLAMIYAVMYIFWNTDEDETNYTFFKRFTILANSLLIPTIIFWAYSLWLRIDAYKLTVNRFALMVIIVWFLLNSLYLLIAKKKDIKVILTSFIILISITFFLPFSSFYFSNKAQLTRFNEIAVDQNVLVDGKYAQVAKETKANSDQDMKDILRYLNQFHDLNTIKPLLSDNISKKLEIDQSGYSKYLVTRYGYGENLFFKELLPISDYANMGNTYISIFLDNSSLDIPKEYKTFDVLDNYAYSQIKYTKDSIEVNGNIYKIDIDLKSEKLLTFTENMIHKNQYFGPNAYFVKDQTFLTFESNDTKLMITELNGSTNDGKFTEINSIVGIIFKK